MKESTKANVPHTKGPGTPSMDSIRMQRPACTAPVKAEPSMAPLTVACTDANSASMSGPEYGNSSARRRTRALPSRKEK